MEKSTAGFMPLEARVHIIYDIPESAFGAKGMHQGKYYMQVGRGFEEKGASFPDRSYTIVLDNRQMQIIPNKGDLEKGFRELLEPEKCFYVKADDFFKEEIGKPYTGKTEWKPVSDRVMGYILANANPAPKG